MKRILEIERCEDCKFLHDLGSRDGNIQGYCEYPQNRELDVKKININPGYIGARDRLYPKIDILSIDTIRLPGWCRLPTGCAEPIPKQQSPYAACGHS